MTINPLSIYVQSGRLIAKEVENEFIIATITSIKGSAGEGLYFLNETGRELWERLDGKHSLDQLIAEISKKYSADFREQIRKDLCDLIGELLEHGIIKKIE